MYPKAYIDYLIYFHTKRDYFECHEVLEEYWKSTNKQDKVWVGLIQLAVSLYHYRRGNYIGATKLLTKATAILERDPIEKLGLDKNLLLEKLSNLGKMINEKESFHDINLPIINKHLQVKCEEICIKNGLQWGVPSDLNDKYNINKHSLRDRSDVIDERERVRKFKKK